jgi:peroxiredoxin
MLEDMNSRVVRNLLLVCCILTFLGCVPTPLAQEAGSGSIPTPAPTPTSTPAYDEPSGTPPVGTQVGSTAPDFALVDLDGNTVRLSDLRGQVVMLNFWAVWCGFCQIEFPAIQAGYEAHRDQGFVVLAVDVQEERDVVRAFMEDMGATFPALLDAQAEVTLAYRIRGLPTSVFIDQDGIIFAVHIGPLDKEALDDYLTQVGVD